MSDEKTATGIQTKKQFGGNGPTSITGTGNLTRPSGWYSIAFKEDTVIESITGNYDGVLNGESFPAGFTMEIEFTQIKLTSGSAIAYKK